MPARKTHLLPLTGPISTSWREALPPTEVGRVIDFMQQVWNNTPAYQKFHHGSAEPYLTRVLCSRLQQLKFDARLTGMFTAERLIDHMDEETGEFGTGGRADIQYFSDVPGIEIDLIFEFKKLRDKKDHRMGYSSRGMDRFVTGLYSEHHQLAVMVGITAIEDRDKALKALRKHLLIPAKTRELGMMLDAGKAYLHVAEPDFEAYFDFQTVHQRTGGMPQITLGHMFVNLRLRALASAKSTTAASDPDD